MHLFAAIEGVKRGEFFGSQFCAVACERFLEVTASQAIELLAAIERVELRLFRRGEGLAKFGEAFVHSGFDELPEFAMRKCGHPLAFGGGEVALEAAEDLVSVPDLVLP